MGRRAAASVVLGVATTIVIAWVAAPVVEHLKPAPGLRPRTGSYYLKGERAGVYEHERALLFESVWSRRIIYAGLPEHQEFFGKDLPRPWAAWNTSSMEEGYEEAWTYAAGWPWRAFTGVSWQRDSGRGGGGRRDGLVVAGTRRGRWAVVPLRPYWPGLAGDVGAWSLAWAVVLVGPRAWRRHRRRRRGRCVECGYDRAGLEASGICPECGPRLARPTRGRAWKWGVSAAALGAAASVIVALSMPGRVRHAPRGEGELTRDKAASARVARADQPGLLIMNRWEFREQGWPWASAWSWKAERMHFGNAGAAWVRDAGEGWLDFGRPPEPAREVACLPIAGGALANAGVFTGGWWIGMVVCGWARSRVSSRARTEARP